jgi:hypothetical protein
MPTSNATSSATSATAIQDAVVSSIKQSQELALSSISAWADLTSKLPFPAFEGFSFPGAPGAPEARELVDAQFDFAAEVLELNKQFSTKLLDALAPKKAAK